MKNLQLLDVYNYLKNVKDSALYYGNRVYRLNDKDELVFNRIRNIEFGKRYEEYGEPEILSLNRDCVRSLAKNVSISPMDHIPIPEALRDERSEICEWLIDHPQMRLYLSNGTELRKDKETDEICVSGKLPKDFFSYPQKGIWHDEARTVEFNSKFVAYKDFKFEYGDVVMHKDDRSLIFFIEDVTLLPGMTVNEVYLPPEVKYRVCRHSKYEFINPDDFKLISKLKERK